MNRSLSIIVFLFGSVAAGSAAGVFVDGQSARSMALGGSQTAVARGPMDALGGNPAALSAMESAQAELGGSLGLARGHFTNAANQDSAMDTAGVVPQGALGMRWGRFSLGLGALSQSAARTDWRFEDAPGGLDGHTSYGRQPYESELVVLRTALGAAYRVSDTFSMGLAAGLLYNENRLHAPYTFQTQPVLRGAKTLLDLQTNGWGANATAGLLWKPAECLSLGLSYTTESRIRSRGRAHADTGAQLKNIGLGSARARTDFDAEVTNVFPQTLSGGVAWKVLPRLTLGAQVDWINWAAAFDTLEVRLQNSNNADLNGLIGTDHIDEDIALDWRDQFVGRFGVEFHADEHWTLRAGYSFGRNPVGAATLTPLTAAIAEHTVSAGGGYRWKQVSVDLAWQWQLPATAHVGTSRLAPEYNESRTQVGVHWIGLTTSVFF